MTRPAIAGASLTVALAIAPALSQAPAQVPVFRGGVDRVAVDFLALRSDGQPVTDVTLADLSLKVDGKLREIRSLELVRLVPAAAPPASALPPAAAVPAPFGSNAPADAGRAIILVFHHTALLAGEERVAKVAATKFIGTLNARDRVALITIREGGVIVDLTTDHGRVIKGLQQVTGHPSTPGEAHVLRDLVGLMDSFARIDGPKVVVFVSSRLPDAGGANFAGMDFANEYREVGKAAAKARVQLYIMQPQPLDGPRTGIDEGLGWFAGAVGGTVFTLIGSGDSEFRRVDAESSAYYLLSFDADRNERDGKTHKIAVTSERPGFTIRARPEFLIPKTGEGMPPRTQVRSLLKDLEPHRDLALRTVAYSFRATAGKLTALVATDTPSGGQITAASYALIDDKGKVVAAWDADAGDLATTPVVSATTILPGSYRLRVAATAADGRMGAVDYEYVASLTRVGSISIGGLMLGQLRGEKFVPQIDFTSESAVAAYVEVYGKVAPGQRATVTLEVAATADGAAVVSVPAAITPTKDADRWLATADIPLSALAVGDHVVRAVARIGNESGTVIRTLRKSQR
jgi:VWFA-related protein